MKKKEKNMEKMIDYDAIVLSNIEQHPGSDIYELRLAVPSSFASQARPGMYSAFSPRDGTHQQRRPFSIVDAQKNQLVFLIKAVGPNTGYYVRRKSGDKINITDPRGQSIYRDEKFDHCVLVGGSIGAAALIFFAKSLRWLSRKVDVFLGAKNISQIVGKKYFTEYGCNTRIITEEGGDADNIGLVTDLLGAELGSFSEKTCVVACGPIPMMKAVADMCAEHNIYCLVMLESIFACSMGACMGCTVFMRDKTTRQICKDGPAFFAPELDWDSLTRIQPAPEKRKKITACDMSVVLAGQDGRVLKLKYPTIGASGCQSESSLSQGYLDIDFLGAISTKGLSLYPSVGNLPPRVCETPAGMLNAIGLENIGLEPFIAGQLPKLLSFGKPVIVNIHGKTVLEYIALAQGLEVTGISAIELNISCPNVDKGMAFGVDKDLAYEVVRAVREATSKFLIVKLTPNVTDHIPIAKAAEKAGADAISLINTLMGMEIDIETRRPKLRNIFGGLSGPAIRPVALRMVYQLYKADLNIPIIGIGGINDFASALKFFMAGAKAIQVGTASFGNSGVFADIAVQLKDYMLENGFSNIDELSGSLIID